MDVDDEESNTNLFNLLTYFNFYTGKAMHVEGDFHCKRNKKLRLAVKSSDLHYATGYTFISS